MSIVGLPFDQGVKNQINQRSKLMANTSQKGSLLGIDPDKALLAQNKTSWVRLSSGVNIEAPSTEEAPKEIVEGIQLRVNELKANLGTSEGNTLARNYILTQGTRSADSEGNFLNQRSGIGLNGAYGIGGDRFGYKPMPALQSINVSYYNRGSLAKADIKIKVFSADQLSYIETLYMRPGYTVLLEWGHSTYIDNAGNYADAKTKGTPVLRTFLNPPQVPTGEIITAGPDTGTELKTEDGKLRDTALIPQGVIEAAAEKGESTLKATADVYKVSVESLKARLPSSSKLKGGDQTSTVIKKTRNTNTRDIYNKIKSERVNWSYNYDGFYGKITNFNWTFNEDGSYDVTLKAITVGDIIESLGVNSTVKGLSLSEKAGEEAGKKVDQLTENAAFEFLAGESAEQQRLKKVFEQAQGNALINGLFQVMLGGTEATSGNGNKDRKTKRNFNFDRTPVFDTGKTVNTRVSYFTYPEEVRKALNLQSVKKAEVIEVEYKVDKEEAVNLGSGQFYITLGCFLRYLEENFIVYTEKLKPYFTIDSDYYKADGKTIATPISTFPGHISGNPLVCLIPGQYFPSIENLGVLGVRLTFNKELGITTSINYIQKKYVEAPFNDPDNHFIGNMMSIYVNFDTIIQSINKNTDDNGQVKFIKLIKDILSKIKQALGGVHEFETRFVEDENQFSIYEQGSHIVNQYNDARSKLVTFSPYGINSTRGSIAKSISFSSELTNEFATQISIGAQANGNQVGENATAYSTYNQGLVDRIERVKLKTSDGKDPNKIETGKVIQETLAKLSELAAVIYDVDGKEREITQESITALKNLNKDYAKYVQGYWVETKKACQPPFFIPFNLSLTLEGISGIKLYEKFLLDDSILPYSYRNKVDFLVKNLTHTVESEKWETKLETLAIPRLTGPGGKSIIKKPELPKETTLLDPDQLKAENTGDLKTLVLGLPIKSNIFDPRRNNPTMIILHHTAGAQGDPAGNIRDWNTRTKNRASAHYVIGVGSYDQLVDTAKYSAWHAGHGSTYPVNYYNTKVKKAFGSSGTILNGKSIGIEIQAYGYLVQKNNKWYAYDGTSVPKIEIPDDQTAEPYYFDGKKLPKGYKGFKRYHKYTPYQIKTLKAILLADCKKYKIPFVWNQAAYDEMFPNAKNFNGNLKDEKTYKANLSRKCMNYIPGIYSHNSSRIDKSDIFPQKELLDMLAELSKELGGTTDSGQVSDEVYKNAAEKMFNLAESSGVLAVYPGQKIYNVLLETVNSQESYNRLAIAWKANTKLHLLTSPTPDEKVPTLRAFLVEIYKNLVYSKEVNELMKQYKITWTPL